jgi:hypothetical protein
LRSARYTVCSKVGTRAGKVNRAKFNSGGIVPQTRAGVNVSISQQRRSSRVARTLEGAARRILEQARRRLHLSSHQQIRQIRCDMRDGYLTLRGRVPSYYLKQLAQELVGGGSAPAPIDNRIIVRTRCHPATANSSDTRS